MKICVWRYLENEKNYPGFHLSADQEGCAYILQRLNDEWDVSTIELDQSDTKILSVPNAEAECRSFLKLRIESGANPEIDMFTPMEQDSVLVLTLGAKGLGALIKGIEDMATGEGDYSIRSDCGEPLWFWWQAD